MDICSCGEFKTWHTISEKKCYYCGIPESLLKIIDWHHETVRRLTVDRKNPNEGYVLGNIVLCCERCNLIKNDFLTVTEMKQIAHKYITPKWKKLYENRYRS
jgi:hypothetical protein